MSSFFGGIGGNPFSTPVGQRIEQATEGTLASENWGLNMEICDIINETEDGPKDGIKAIRKRLTGSTGKSYTMVMYTLTVLETCVKNCGKRFHVYVATKDVLQELIKIIGPKNDPPQVVQEKILSLIQTWADAFRGSPDLKEVEKVYRDLKNKGIEFPMTDLDSLAPIHTPARSTPEMDPAMSRPPPQRTGSAIPQQQSPYPAQQPYPAPPQPYPSPQQPYPAPQMNAPMVAQMVPAMQMAPQPYPAPQVVMQQQVAPQGPSTLNAEQMAKLRSELDLVQGNYKVFGEMLTEMNPAQTDPADWELLQELNRTCRTMQIRIVELVERVANEEVTGELLRINDEMNNVFLRYDRFERFQQGQTGQTPASTEMPVPPPAMTVQPIEPPPPSYSSQVPPGAATTANLIDLADTAPQNPPTSQSPFAPASTSDIHLQLAGMNLGANSVSSTLGQLNSTTATNTQQQQAPDEFDMFAQSRQSFDQSKQASGEVYTNQRQPDQFSGGLGAAVNAKNTGNPYNKSLTDKPSDFEEMEKWLKENPSQQGAEDPDSITSTEFDRFLAERAAAADTPQDPPASNPALNQANRTQPQRPNRQMQKKDETENALFAL